ncbi:MAG: anthranilate phosphoribosyltransferase, partial [Vicinamibacterales bacterium]
MFTALLEKLMRHEDLTEDEAAGAMREVMDGRAPSVSLAALLSALVMKGERPAEIVGFARTMR